MTESAITRRAALKVACAGLATAASVSFADMTSAAVKPAPAGSRMPANFTDPVWNQEASARLEGDITPGKQVHGWASGVVNGVVAGQKVKPLVRFDVFSSTRVLHQEDGSYQRLSRELVFYRDVETRQFLEEWNNPYTNERVRVVEVANDPFNWKITEFFPDPPSYGGLNKDKPPRRPFLLNWGSIGPDIVTLEADINLLYPSALQPDKWPRESPGKMSQVSELFRYFIQRADLENPARTHVPYVGTWVRINPWLPWMLMDQAPGHVVYVGDMTSQSSFEGAAPDVLARVKERYPKYLTAPEAWEEPSLSSLEHYAREQKPAPPKPAPPSPAPPSPAPPKP